MSPKLFLPLVITAFLASAAAANTSNGTTHASSPRIATQCSSPAQKWSQVARTSPDSLADTAIGRIYSTHTRFAANGNSAIVRGLERMPFPPYMVASLEVPLGSAPNGAPASCYPPLSFATDSLPHATAGSSYTVNLNANGGQPPYRWSFGRSSLPSGFSLSSTGDLTGTPSQPGTYVFNVVLSDSLKNNVTEALTLTVVADDTPPTTPPVTPPPTTPPVTPPPTTPPVTPPPTTPPVTPPPTTPPVTPPPTTPPVTPPPTTPPVTPPPTTPPVTPPPTTPPVTPPPTTPPVTPPPTTPPVTPPPTTPPGPATGTALNACGDLTKSGSYYLANDVSSVGACFGIDADGIKLNLNGHTITYGTGGGSTPTPAIEAHDCWSTANPGYGGPCGNAHGGLEVYGGTIVQSPNSASFSPIFGFGQGAFSSAPYIHDITATFQNTGAQFYNSAYLPAGAKIVNNTIHDNVTSINHPGQVDLSARSAFQGQAIYIGQNRNNPGSGDLIENNKIIGSPQGGLYSDNQHTVFSGNDISMNARYSNDFCIAMGADYQEAKDNNCHPRSGRGIHVNANYNVISNNTITVTELKQNAEYSGCQHGGTYGIQMEFDNSFMPVPPVGIKVTGNTVTANAGDCDALGLRLTSMTPAGNASFTGNTITTTNTGGAGKDIGISMDSEIGTNVTITGNTFRSSYAYAGGDWDGYSNNVFGHNTWLGTPTYTFLAGDGACAPGQGGDDAICPSSVTFTDDLPKTVACGSYSVATVTIGSHVTQCKPTAQ